MNTETTKYAGAAALFEPKAALFVGIENTRTKSFM